MQIVTNDNNEVKHEEEAKQSTHDYLNSYIFLAYFASNALTRSCNSLFAFTKYAINPM